MEIVLNVIMCQLLTTFLATKSSYSRNRLEGTEWEMN
jgi:hypothetical protein